MVAAFTTFMVRNDGLWRVSLGVRTTMTAGLMHNLKTNAGE